MISKVMRKHTAISLILFISLIILFSCKNDNKEIDYNPNINVSVETVWAQMAFTDVFNFVFTASKDTTLLNTGFNEINGAKVYYNASSSPQMKFKFANYFQLCPDHCIRRGEFNADFDGDFNDPGTMATITYEDYYFEYIRLNANHQITYEGKNQNQQEVYNNVITSGNLLVMDTISPWGYTWNGNQQLIWVDGADTPLEPEDDVLEVTGSSDGKASSGADYQVEVSSALANVFSCKWIPSGVQHISTPGLLVTSGQIDFLESDSCSNYVGFVFDGNPFYTTLKKVK